VGGQEWSPHYALILLISFVDFWDRNCVSNLVAILSISSVQLFKTFLDVIICSFLQLNFGSHLNLSCFLKVTALESLNREAHSTMLGKLLLYQQKLT